MARLSPWATTSKSIIICILGSIFPRVGRALTPLNTPLLDSLDYVTRLRMWLEMHSAKDLRITSVDFSVLFTNFMWSDVAPAHSYWSIFLWVQQRMDSPTPNEVVFVTWLLAPITQETYNGYIAH